MASRLRIYWSQMIFCYPHRLVPSLIVIREDSSRNWWKQMKKKTSQSKIRWSWGNSAEEREESLQNQRSQKHHKKNPENQLSRAHRESTKQGPYILMWSARSLNGVNLGLMHTCNSWVAWSFSGFLTAGTGTVSDSFTGFWGPSPHAWSPCQVLIQVEVLSLTTSWYAVLCQYLGRLSLFWTETGGVYGGVQRGGGKNWEEEGGNCSWDVS